MRDADFDGDGGVDADDLARWLVGFGRNASGDANADGDSTGDDLLIWQRQAAANAVTAIPEPATAFGCAVLTIGTLLTARRRSIHVH